MHELHQLCGLLLVEDRGAPGNFVLASEKVLLPDDYSITLLIQRKLWINQNISAAQTFWQKPMDYVIWEKCKDKVENETYLRKPRNGSMTRMRMETGMRMNWSLYETWRWQWRRVWGVGGSIDLWTEPVLTQSLAKVNPWRPLTTEIPPEISKGATGISEDAQTLHSYFCYQNITKVNPWRPLTTKIPPEISDRSAQDAQTFHSYFCKPR